MVNFLNKRSEEGGWEEGKEVDESLEGGMGLRGLALSSRESGT